MFSRRLLTVGLVFGLVGCASGETSAASSEEPYSVVTDASGPETTTSSGVSVSTLLEQVRLDEFPIDGAPAIIDAKRLNDISDSPIDIPELTGLSVADAEAWGEASGFLEVTVNTTDEWQEASFFGMRLYIFAADGVVVSASRG